MTPGPKGCPLFAARKELIKSQGRGTQPTIKGLLQSQQGLSSPDQSPNAPLRVSLAACRALTQTERGPSVCGYTEGRQMSSVLSFMNPMPSYIYLIVV